MFCYYYYIFFFVQSSILLFSVLSMLFILICLILILIVHVTMTFVCVLRVASTGLFLAIIVYIIIVIITTILFFSILPVIGGEFSNWIRAAWSTPTHWLLWVSRRVSINFTFIFILWCHHWGVDALFHIYHMTSFNYDAKGARDVGLSCRCHLSNSQIASSVQNMLERITCLWLCVSVLFVHLFFSFLLVFFFVFF